MPLGTTTRERIHLLASINDELALNRVEDGLLTRLDELTLTLGELRQALAGGRVSSRVRLNLLERRETVEEDLRLAQESLAYLRFRKRQEQERGLREAMKDLCTYDEPSVHRKDALTVLIALDDAEAMRRLLNRLMEQRTRIISNRETLENALQHVTLMDMLRAEVAFSAVDDIVAALDNDITLLWRALNRSL